MNIGVILILLLILNSNKDNKILSKPMNKNKTIDLNIPYTMSKIRIMKKIGPYFPEELLPPVNKAVIIAEKLIKLYEALEFIQLSDANYIKNTISVENNKERLSYIANTIQNEVSNEEIKNMGMGIEMIVNMNKYSKMFTILNSIMSNPDNLNDPSEILNLMEPFMQGMDEKEKKKIKDMANMLEIMQKLDKPQKSKEKDE